MTSYEPPVALWHCTGCGVEWTHWRKLPCWLCGGDAAEGQDRSAIWTARAAYRAAEVEKELAS